VEAPLAVLKLFLDVLEVPSQTETLNDRKRVQHAMYLGQALGSDLGYRFGWYKHGPYSLELVNDHKLLAEAIASGDRSWESIALPTSVHDALSHVAPLLRVPDTVQLFQADWLELLASLDYLRRVRRCQTEEAIQILATTKPHLASFAPGAAEMLDSLHEIESGGAVKAAR
jgi:hypothetical protein